MNSALRVTLSEKAPKAVTITEGNRTINITDFCAKVWNILQGELNFISTYVSAYKEWGEELPNKSWTGMIGALTRDEADLGLSLFTMSSSRGRVVDFLYPLKKGKTMLFIQDPQTYNWNWNGFLSPFKWTIWGAMAGTLMILALGLFAICKFRTQFDHIGTEEGMLSFQNSLFCILCGYCGQGQTITAKSWACRILYLTSYLVGVVLLAAYSASLASFLTIQHPKLPFETLGELLEEGTYKFHVLAGVESSYFVNSTDGVMKEIYTKIISQWNEAKAQTVDEAIIELCTDSKYALMASYTHVAGQEIENCRIISLPRTTIPGTQSFIIRKGSHYKRVLDQTLQDLWNTGVLPRLRKMYYYFENIQEDNDPVIEVKVQDVAPIFMILTSGALTAFLLLTIEHWARQQPQKYINF